MRNSLFETFIGLIVLLIAGVFLFYAFQEGVETSASGETIEIGARFNSAAGIDRGTDVRMAGVKIGTVRDVSLDTQRVEALVTMAVSQDILPIGEDSIARVQSESLLGGSYINIDPADGFAEIEMCGPDEVLFGGSGCGEMLYAQGSIDLMTLFASFAAGSGNSDSDAGDFPE